ncbi:MAG: hypothetical protein DMG13_21875 [Acidobacteria bacterium]|nr:MAG: hypothetical protein DMG13_21875 [Acidobacteriota bacterium]
MWNPSDASRAQRLARYEVMETYVRTHLLPYDFSLTSEQEADLFAEVRALLERSPDDELFSVFIRAIVEEVVETKIRPWREENRLRSESDRLKEVRDAAADYVGSFLSLQATPAAVEQLKQRFGIDDSPALEAALRMRISAWVGGLEDEQLAQYDVFTVKDLVFAQLRSWC